jgi:hypothetical protein
MAIANGRRVAPFLTDPCEPPLGRSGGAKDPSRPPQEETSLPTHASVSGLQSLFESHQACMPCRCEIG